METDCGYELISDVPLGWTIERNITVDYVMD